MTDQAQLQRTDKWFQDRCGKFTGSRFVDVLARNKKTGEPLEAYNKCVWQVVTERISGVPLEGPTGRALQWGTDVEPFARQAYELETGFIVTESEFVTHPKYPFAGCSPDGLVSDIGGIEMKCPKDSALHLQRFLGGIPDEYRPQCQGFLWVTDREWIDFVSYDPRQTPEFQMLKVRAYRNETLITQIENAVIQAEADANELIERLKRSAA